MFQEITNLFRETNILPGLTGCWDHLAFVIIVKGMAHSKVGRNWGRSMLCLYHELSCML